MRYIKRNVSLLILFSLLIIPVSGHLFAYGDGLFYIGGSLDLYNPRQDISHWIYSYDRVMNNGFNYGFGVNFGLNLIDNLSLPDISCKYFRINHNIYEDEDFEEMLKFQLQYVIVRIGVKYGFENYRIKPYARVGISYENIRFKYSDYEHDEDYNYYVINEIIFFAGVSPYFGAGLSYFINDKASMDLELIYTHGRGTDNTEECNTFPLGGTTISSSLTFYPF